MKYQTMKTPAGSGDALFISAINVGKWLASCAGLFTSAERTSSTHWTD
jgi:hypothetical protein